MPCNVVRGDGFTAIVCTRGRKSKPCVVCGRPHAKLCDYPLTGEKQGKTCDRALCAQHTAHVPPDTDYCPTHARRIEAAK